MSLASCVAVARYCAIFVYRTEAAVVAANASRPMDAIRIATSTSMRPAPRLLPLRELTAYGRRERRTLNMR
jgi:hypothetical protein